MTVIVLLLVNIDIWYKITFPKWQQTLDVLPTFSMSDLIETEDSHTTCLYTFHVPYVARRHWDLCCALVNPDGETGTNYLRISRKAARPGAATQSPQITFWEHSTLNLCVPDLFTSVWGNLAPSELKGLFSLKFQLKSLLNILKY